MVFLTTWKVGILASPSLLASTVEHGLGYEQIKPEQLTAVQSLLKCVNVFMSVPTGFGKSLRY